MSAKRPTDYDAEVGANLRALRLSYTVKQIDLATRLGVQRAAVTRWERGTRGLTVDMLLRIADTFGVPASRLLPQRHQESGTASMPAQQRAEAPQSLEESAIASIAQVLRERPELIIAMMQFLEQQAVVSDGDGVR
jgi:transcriptional regulator with XRE-family HTH domain